MVNFWLEENVPSPNKRDVKIKHSEQPGDHKSVKDPNIVSFSFHCKQRSPKQLQEGWCNMCIVNCVRNAGTCI